MSLKRQDVLTTANAITIAGLLCTFAGAWYLYYWWGLGLALLGRVFDNLDGFVARRTHTSAFGAALDANADKWSGLALLLASWSYGTAPKVYIGFCFIQQIIVVLLAVLAGIKKRPLRVMNVGKINMFLQVSALLVFAIGYQLDGILQLLATLLASLLAGVSAITGIITTLSYEQSFRNIFSKSTTSSGN